MRGNQKNLCILETLCIGNENQGSIWGNTEIKWIFGEIHAAFNSRGGMQGKEWEKKRKEQKKKGKT